MDEKPLISIIVPVYKIEQYIGLCIESIINQDYTNIEVILVDDGSPDRCPSICDLYRQKDRRIRVIHKVNGGLVSARKAGLEIALGKYIGYVDGDDWIESDFYQVLITAAIFYDADVVIAGQERDFFEKKERIFNGLSPGLYEGDQLKILFSQMISKQPFYDLGIFTYVWNKLFKRELVYKAQMGVDERIFIGEDAACTYSALLTAKRVVVTNNCSYHYRQREDSMLKKSAPFEHEASFIKILHKCLQQELIGQDTGISKISTLADPYNLRQQIDDFILSIFIIRSGGLLPCDSSFARTFPFRENIQNKQVAIFSAGTFGQQLRTRLNAAEHCRVVGWFDDDYWEYRRCCLDVDPVTAITSVEFDYIIVATVNGDLAKAMKARLMALGVEESKILTIDCTAEERRRALVAYLS